MAQREELQVSRISVETARLRKWRRRPFARNPFPYSMLEPDLK